MTPQEFKDDLLAQWKKVPVRLPAVGGVHARGPDGSWMSFSLRESGQPRAWLHFRQVPEGIEYAFGDDGYGPDSLQWEPIDKADIPAAIREFEQNFVESMPLD